MEERSMQMRHGERKGITAVFVFFATLVVISAVKGQQIPVVPGGAHFPNPSGASQTYSTTGKGIDLTGPFFQSLGVNGRTCGTCHQPSDGMSISAGNVQRRFELNPGQNPNFPPNEGGQFKPTNQVFSLPWKVASHKLFWARGFIRILITV